jgi:NAD(P)-dependent dehydrogenase (short-subunit alcohol dehydrogenase family)
VTSRRPSPFYINHRPVVYAGILQVALVRSIALENKDRCISANTVLPGTMDTSANRAADPKADPLQWVQPVQVAALLLHLASDAGAQVTGAAIPIYGRQV